MASVPEPGQPSLTENHEPKRTNWVAGGALIGAGLASVCCIVPLLLVMKHPIELGGAAEDVAFHVALGRWFADTRRVPRMSK